MVHTPHKTEKSCVKTTASDERKKPVIDGPRCAPAHETGASLPAAAQRRKNPETIQRKDANTHKMIIIIFKKKTYLI